MVVSICQEEIYKYHCSLRGWTLRIQSGMQKTDQLYNMSCKCFFGSKWTNFTPLHDSIAIYSSWLGHESLFSFNQSSNHYCLIILKKNEGKRIKVVFCITILF
uniref:Actin-related protein 2/3 complex subunit 3 n=1 Tax=Rhizophora mucronata TaxID=61149 RepID=A0A2P2JSJ6_RHIMU